MSGRSNFIAGNNGVAVGGVIGQTCDWPRVVGVEDGAAGVHRRWGLAYQKRSGKHEGLKRIC